MKGKVKLVKKPDQEIFEWCFIPEGQSDADALVLEDGDMLIIKGNRYVPEDRFNSIIYFDHLIEPMQITNARFSSSPSKFLVDRLISNVPASGFGRNTELYLTDCWCRLFTCDRDAELIQD